MVSGFVYVMNSYFVSNANYHTVFCHSHIKDGYKDCGTKIITNTGGILVDNIYIYIYIYIWILAEVEANLAYTLTVVYSTIMDILVMLMIPQH